MVRGQDCDLDHNEGDLRYNRTGNHLDRLTLYPKSGKEAGWRELIRARTGEGRSRAKARGVRFGRPPKLTTHQRQEAFQRLANGETQADIARTYAVHPATIGECWGPPAALSTAQASPAHNGQEARPPAT
jgi:DNA invertase Pin-like site-specific DNA recombinase